MKSSLFSLLFHFAFIASSAKALFVVDTNGNNVLNGGTYYILPEIWASGGGLELEKKGNETCALNVVQSFFEIERGIPWRIRSQFKMRDVPTNVKLELFSVEGEVPTCVPSQSKWTIVEGDDGIKSVRISGDGDENTLNGWFKIKKYNSKAYKIVFCPINGNSCGDIGTSSDRRLVITDDDNPLVVVFVKNESSEV